MEEFFTINELQTALKNKKVSLNEVAQIYLQRIKNNKLNAFITQTDELTLKMVQNTTFASESLPLFGAPIAVKDNFCVKDIRTTNASKILHNYFPPYESTITSRFWAAGAIITGKTNMDEFAMGSSGKSSYFGPTASPWTLDGENLNTGGSSSGSAASVCAGLSLVSIGTDTGGSVRQPAAFCGLFGYKPTYGMCSRWGIIAYASSFDQVGFFARSVTDVALMTDVVGGADDRDATLKNIAKYNLSQHLNGDLHGKKIGIIKELLDAEVDPEIKSGMTQALDYFKSIGVEVIEVSIPNIAKSINVYQIVSRTEAASNLARYDGVKFGHRVQSEDSTYQNIIENTRADGFGVEVQNRILVGTTALFKDFRQTYDHLILLRKIIKHEFNEAFNKVDAILTPTSPILAPKQSQTLSQMEEYLCDIFTLPANVAGLPAISVPISLSKDNRSVSVQLMSNSFNDATMLQFAQALEKGFNFIQQNRNFLESIITK